MCAKDAKGCSFTSSKCTSCRGNDIYCDSSGFARLWVEINHIYRIHLMVFFLCLHSSLSSCCCVVVCQIWSYCVDWGYEISGGSKGGHRGRVPPWGPKFFQFHAVFGKFWQNRMLATPVELAPPPQGNPGSATENVS